VKCYYEANIILMDCSYRDFDFWLLCLHSGGQNFRFGGEIED